MQKIYKLLITLILILSLMLSYSASVCASNIPLYLDVGGDHWAYDAIKFATKSRYFSGDGDGHFRPDDTITRAEAVKVIVTVLHRDRNSSVSSYADVDANEWYAPYVEAGKDLLPFTMDSNYFRPTELVTREDTIYALVRSLKLTNKVDYVDVDGLSKFADADQIHPETAPYMAMALQLSVISGYSDGTIQPDKPLTRAEFAVLLYRAKNL